MEVSMNGSVKNTGIGTENIHLNQAFCAEESLNALVSLRHHWPEYAMEAGEIALYVFLICSLATLFLHPSSPFRHVIESLIIRRALMGSLVGLTVVAITMTPWGRQSGGHFNPAITLAFYRLGKLSLWDAIFYVAAQFGGAVAGIQVAAGVIRDAKDPLVRYAVTIPGIFGNAGAFAGEPTTSFVLMTGILVASSRDATVPYTPYLVGALYAVLITAEAPLSGTSMNPARTFASAFRAGYWQAFWIYVIAPTVGMLAAAEIYLFARAGVGPYCAKVHYGNDKRCIFQHGYRQCKSNVLFTGDMKMNKWKMAVPVLAIVLFVAWYDFRPERLFLNHQVNEMFPVPAEASTAQVLKSGTFYGVMHPTTGTATIYGLNNGDRVLRFTDFKTSNGPDVHVYLVAVDNANDSATVKRAKSIDLGTIKGNIGAQNYPLARDLDLSKYRTVSIWCKRFSVNFGAAPLRPNHVMSQRRTGFIH